MSAHRDPEMVREYCTNARMRGLKVIIAGAGMSAALPGVAAAHTDLPVIGVPILGKSLGGLDALLSAVQMPPGHPGRLRGDRRGEERRRAGGADHQLRERDPPLHPPEIGAVWSAAAQARVLARGRAGGDRGLGRGGRRARGGRRGGAGERRLHGRGGQRARAGHRPRRRRLRRRRRRLGRRARALDPLRPHLLRRARHGAGAAAAAGGRRSSLAGARAYRDALVERALEQRDTLCVGRTHGVHAEPTTFGLRLAGFAFEADRNLAAGSSDAFEQLAFGKLSGAVGTYASVPPAVEARVMERLGLGREDVATQVVPRDRHAVLTSTDRDRRRRPRALRDRGPQPAADRGARGRGAVRRRPEGLLGDAPQAQPDPHRADHRPRPRPARLRPGRARERRPLARARHLPLRRRAGDPARRDDRPRLHAGPGGAASPPG